MMNRETKGNMTPRSEKPRRGGKAAEATSSVSAPSPSRSSTSSLRVERDSANEDTLILNRWPQGDAEKAQVSKARA